MYMSTAHSKSKKIRRLCLIAVAIVLIGYVALRLLRPGIGFTYYQPGYLPPGVSIKARRITIIRNDASVEQDFRTNDWVYEIQEYKARTSIGTAAQNYDPKSVKPTCSLLTSPVGQHYRLCHWVDYGQIDLHQVIFIKSGTYIRADIPTSLQQPISTAEINKFVDSFKHASTRGLPVDSSEF